MKKEETLTRKLDMLEKIYETRELDFEEENKKDRMILSELSHGVSLEEIEANLKQLLKKIEKDKQTKEDKSILEQLERLIENYEIQVAYYSQKNYKRGFKDAVQLYTQCLREDAR